MRRDVQSDATATVARIVRVMRPSPERIIRTTHRQASDERTDIEQPRSELLWLVGGSLVACTASEPDARSER
jgi:hypothetical protein